MPSQQPTISWVSLNSCIVGLLYRSILFHACVLRVVKNKGLSNCLIGKCKIAQFFDWSVRSQGLLELDSVHISFVLVSAAAIDTRIFHESTQSDEVRISSQIIHDIKIPFFFFRLSIFFSLIICLYFQEFHFVFSLFLKVWVLANCLLSEYSLNQITLPIYGLQSGRAILSTGTSYFSSLHHILISILPYS